MRMVTASGRSRWPYVIGAAVIVVAIGGGLAYNITRPAPATVAAPPSSTPTATGTAPSGDTNLGDDVAPTGCLGGLDRTADMVLTAQAEAKHTTFGAVEVATAFYRWFWQYPSPQNSESDLIGSEVIAATAPDSWKNVTGQYESSAWNGRTADYKARGGEFHTSSTNGLWRITEASTADRVNVEMTLGTVIDGALSPTKATLSGFVMVWEGNAWHIETGIPVDETKLTNGGTRFTGGC